MRNILSIFRNKMSSFPTRKLFIILGVLFVSSCFAAESEPMQTAIEVLNVLFAMISAILTPAVILAGWLLTPDWTMGDFFGLRPYFLKIWILVSNLVYIAFALILLYLAVMQIFAGEDAEYTFKKKLPQFLVGILMVPFTWLIVSWTLSFANQATAAVLAVPMGAISSFGGDSASGQNAQSNQKGLFHDKVIPTTISVNLTDSGKGITMRDCSKEPDARSGTSCISAAEFIKNNGSGPFFIIMIYAYDIFRIQSTDLIPLTEKCDAKTTDAKDCIKRLVDVVIKFGTGMIVTFFFGVLTIALCWVLVMRAFKLWIYIMFSPLFGLAYFTGNGWGEAFHSEGGGGHGGGDSGMSKLGFIPFFKLAMVPVIVAGVLSFGLLFVGAINQTFSVASMTASSGKQSNGDICTAEKGYMVRYCITPDNDKIEGSTSKLIVGNNSGSSDGKDYTIKFEFGNTFSGFLGEKSKSGVASVAGGAIDSVESIFAHILLTLISLVIIWMGIKAAVNHDEVTQAAFAPFAKLGDSVQHFAMELPSHLPLPHPAFALATQGGASAAADAINAFTQGMKDDQRRSLADIMNGTQQKFDQSVDKFVNSQGTFAESVSALKNTSSRKPDDIKKLLVTGLEKAASKISSEDRAAFDAFQADVKAANPKDVKAVMEKHAPIVAKLNDGTAGGGEMKGVSELQTMTPGSVPASSSGASSSAAFPPTTIGSSGLVSGGVSAGDGINKVSFGNDGKAIIEGNLSGPQKQAIKDRRTALSTGSSEDKQKALKELGFTVTDPTKVDAFAQGLLSKADA